MRKWSYYVNNLSVKLLTGQALSKSEKQEITEELWEMLYDFAAYGFIIRHISDTGDIPQPFIFWPPRPTRYLAIIFNGKATLRHSQRGKN